MNPYDDFNTGSITQIRDHAAMIHKHMSAAQKELRTEEARKENKTLIDDMWNLKHACDRILSQQSRKPREEFTGTPAHENGWTV